MTDKGHDSMVYRFKGLIHAIEFFSQRFDTEQIVQYALDFIDELIIVDKVAVFIMEDDHYIPVKQRVYSNQNYSIEASADLQDIVVLHAGLFYPDDILRLFPEDLYEQFPCKLGIPLIMDKKLYGFILLDKQGEFNSDDQIIATALMNLYYTALTNFQSYDELIRIKKKLDEKIFNLFAINQSSKVLMGTLEIGGDICSLSISVFSELTQSAITSMFMYDDISEAYKMMSIQNVYALNQESDMSAYQTSDLVKLTYKSYYNMMNIEEKDIFLGAFHNGELLIEELQPAYVIPVYKSEHLLGFITLGKRVNDSVYNEGIIELVESLSSSLYVSISNAMQVKTIQEQKKEIDSKLNKLMTLNLMIKNINTSSSFENLLMITRDTLNLSFGGVQCGIIGQYDQSQEVFIVRETIECSDFTRVITLDKVKNQLKEGKMVVAHSILEADDILGHDFTKHIENKYSGALIIPIFLDKYEIEMLGVICIFDVDNQIIGDTENQLIFESVSNAIAPVWYQLGQMEKIKEIYVANGSVQFKEQLVEEMNDCDDFDLELHVFHIKYKANNCLDRAEVFDDIKDSYKKCHVIDNSHLMVITGGVESELDDLKEDLPDNYEITHYMYKRDFSDMDTFVEVLEA